MKPSLQDANILIKGLYLLTAMHLKLFPLTTGAKFDWAGISATLSKSGWIPSRLLTWNELFRNELSVEP